MPSKLTKREADKRRRERAEIRRRERYQPYAPCVRFDGLNWMNLLEEPGVVTLAFNRREAEALISAQGQANEGPTGVAILRFSLMNLADHLTMPISERDSVPLPSTVMKLQAWAMCLDTAAQAIRERLPNE